MRDQAIEFSQRAVSQIDQELGRYQLALKVLAASPDLAQDNLSAFYELARRFDETLPDIWDIALRQPDGKGLITTSAPLGVQIDPPDNQTVLAAERKAMQSRDAVVSDLFAGPDGTQFISIVLAVMGDDNPRYLLSIDVPAQRFSNILADQLRSADWLAGLIDNNDTIIARNWEAERYVGKKASQAFKDQTRGNSGTFLVRSRDGVEVFDVYTRSALTGWRLGAGIPIDVFSAPLYRLLYSLALIVLLGLALSIALASYYARRLLKPVDALQGLVMHQAESQSAAPQGNVSELNIIAASLWRSILGMGAINRLGSQLVRTDEEGRNAMTAVVDAAIEIAGARKGNIQLFDPDRGALTLVAQRGFEKGLEFFKTVARRDGSACAAAMDRAERVIVEDVETSAIFAGQPAKDVLLQAGIRAVVSSPLIGSKGDLLGIVSVHFEHPGRPDEQQLHLLDVLVSLAANYIERKHTEAFQDLLRHELNHRTNNLLAVIQAIAHRTLSEGSSPQQLRESFERRLQALARSNRLLGTNKWSAAKLKTVLHSELEPFAERVDIDGVDVALRAKTAQDLSLIVHELATNAVKYGALSNVSGAVAVSWKMASDGQAVKFRWSERGGPPVAPPRRRGFGTTLLSATFPGARIFYLAQGLSCEFDLAVEQPTAFAR
ncbi:MAG TPA: HWE histidine kinase domain-containing protein [Xanthobacteraceae bacterium]|nr:HWE histidine kinase domain-containing protein [Xanthobacteraceae bacterium]